VSGGFSTDTAKAEFWSLAKPRIDSAGYRRWRQDGNFAHLWFPMSRAAKVVIVAGTNDHLLACKLDLLNFSGPRSGEAFAAANVLRARQETLEAELELGALGWAGRTGTRLCAYHPATLGDRSTWAESADWLIDAATRFRKCSSRPCLRFRQRPS
jgi:hypothetical protein